MTDRSDDLVDKVAQALYASNLHQLGTSASYQPKYWRGQSQAAIDALQLSEVRTRLNNAVKAVYANIGPSPVLVEIRLAQELLGGGDD